jgi:hypothetical protein
MGRYYNWVQVYGNNVILWFIPITTQSGKHYFTAGNPLGDGILFATKTGVQLSQQGQ